jgi:hypothetical protein
MRWDATLWDAIDDDPSFILSFRLVRPRFLVIRLEGFDGLVDPILYLDSGNGFSESETLALDCGRRVVCVVALHSLKDLRRIRLDPSTRPLRFSLDIKASNKPAELRKHLAATSPSLPNSAISAKTRSGPIFPARH